jgi:hypothetical protein
MKTLLLLTFLLTLTACVPYYSVQIGTHAPFMSSNERILKNPATVTYGFKQSTSGGWYSTYSHTSDPGITDADKERPALIDTINIGFEGYIR